MNYIYTGFQLGIGLGLAYLVSVTVLFIFSEIITKYHNWRYYKKLKEMNKPPKGMEFGKNA